MVQLQVGKDACSSVGHVAYVEKVNATNGDVESIVISEMNYLSGGRAKGRMQTLEIEAGSNKWPQWFIYVEDL